MHVVYGFGFFLFIYFFFFFFFFFQAEDGIRDLTVTGVQTCALPIFFFKKKYWPLLPLALVFTWTYDLFVLLLMATVLWVLVIAWTERRFAWRPLVWVILGCAAGLVINPYFPQNFRQLGEHVAIKLTMSGFDTKVGSEWYPYDSWEFLGNSAVACIAMVVGYVALEPSERKRAHFPLFLMLFSTALMIMTARWKRIVEYWPPFAVMFAAFSLQAWLRPGFASYLTRLPDHVLEELKPYLDDTKEKNDWREWARVIGAGVRSESTRLNSSH